MKAHILIACCAVLAASQASAFSRSSVSMEMRIDEWRCAKPKAGADEMLRQCLDALQLEHDPKARRALIFDLGVAYAEAGRLNPAMDCFAQVLNANPEDWRALTMRGDGYMRLKRPKDALADAEHVLRVNPNSVYARTLRGRALAALGNYDAALSEMGAAIVLAPDWAPAYNMRGNVYAKMGRTALAIADFDKAIALSPQGAFYNNRCFERAKPDVGDLPGALADCNKALESDSNAQPLDSRGFVYFRMGDYRSAIADYNAALDKKPDYASSLFMRGTIKRKTGDATGGDADIAAAKALDSGVADEYAKYGVVP